MNPNTDLLDHAVDLFPAPGRAFEQLEQSRDRRRRNRRIRAAGVALAIALVGGFGFVKVFRAEVSPQPANSPFTVSEVSHLRLEWTSNFVGGRPSAWSGGIGAANGTIYAFHSPTLYTFDPDCPPAPAWEGAIRGVQACAPSWALRPGPASAGPVVAASGQIFIVSHRVHALTERPRLFSIDGCGLDHCRNACCGAPRWEAELDAPGNLPVVSANTVYVLSQAGTLFAFPMNCVPRNSTCVPTWVAHVPGGYGQVLVSGGRVYVATSGESGRGRVTIFDEHCGSQRASCDPLAVWNVAGYSPPVSLWGAADGVVYVGTGGGTGHPWKLYAMPSSCTSGPQTCTPLWFAAGVGTPSAVAIGNGMIVVADDSNRLRAFPASCRTDGEVCDPVWISGPELGPSPRVLVAGDVVFAGSSGLDPIYAFPLRCASTCAPLWTESAPGGALEFLAYQGKLFVSVRSGLLVFSGGPPRSTTQSAAGSGSPPLPLAVMISLALVAAALLTRRRTRRPLGGT